MSGEERSNVGRRRVILFFVFAIVIVAAFLIVALVNKCSSEHEQDTQIIEQVDNIPSE